MNRIIKKFVMFVLPFLFLFINVSYALEFSSTPVSSNLGNITTNQATVSNDSFIGGLTASSIISVTDSYMDNLGDETFDNSFNSMVNKLKTNGYRLAIIVKDINDPSSYYRLFIFNNNVDIGFYNDKFYFSSLNNSASGEFYHNANGGTLYSCTVPYDGYKYWTMHTNVYYSNISIKTLVNSGGIIWDGTSYYYEAESDEPDTPSLPSNSEIAQAVQAFYNSDYYKNNKNFSDFIVMYSTQTQYFDFIGHTLGNTLGQVIIPPNYRYQGKLYNEQWWKFYIDENQGATAYGTSYYLYSTNDFGENFINEGVGKINELVGLDFSTKSVIVYSTTDYPVRTYVLNEESGDYTYTDGIIEGDQYTYDETLDPTINGYNPLDNFVTVDPSQTIIGDADFEGFANSFEEHKDLFSFTENMQWLIAANNKLSNYFLGFIVMCALFITLSRVMKG